eukprot:3044141-Rhodomonas_salina.1
MSGTDISDIAWHTMSVFGNLPYQRWAMSSTDVAHGTRFQAGSSDVDPVQRYCEGDTQVPAYALATRCPYPALQKLALRFRYAVSSIGIGCATVSRCDVRYRRLARSSPLRAKTTPRARHFGGSYRPTSYHPIHFPVLKDREHAVYGTEKAYGCDATDV